MPNSKGLRPLYLVNELVQSVGEEITYVFDDIVFISHSAVLVQFNDAVENQLFFYMEQGLNESEASRVKAKFENAAEQEAIDLHCKGLFSMSPKEGSDEIDLQFFPA